MCQQRKWQASFDHVVGQRERRRRESGRFTQSRTRGGRRSHDCPLWQGAYLVNNAGVGGGGSYGTWTEASWNWTMGVNLMATGQPGRLHHRAYLGARRIAVVVDRSCEPLARHQRKQRRCGPAIAAIAAATQPGKLERGSPGHVVEAYRARRRRDRVGTSEDLAEHPQFPKERYRRGIV